MSDTTLDEVAALRAGRAFADLSNHRKVRVGGSDARTWLGDLVTADVAGLRPGGSSRSLLLSPTGRIRADFTLVADDDAFVLMQDPEQPEGLAVLLDPYVLSSDVALADLSASTALFCVRGAVADPPDVVLASTPSVLGEGTDLLVPIERAPALERFLSERGLARVGPEAIDAWRIARGDPRMGRDFSPGALPAEAGLEHTIDFSKGCFLGQESAARVRNLGHPAWLLRRLRADGTVSPGSRVLAEVGVVGEVTSSSPFPDGKKGTPLLARVRWEAADARLWLEDGTPLLSTVW